MTDDVRSGFTGLDTGTADTSMTRGALRVANNVVVRRPNVIEQRPGMLKYAFLPTTKDVRSAVEFGASAMFRGYDSDASKWYLSNADLSEATTPDGDAVSPVRDDFPFTHAKARGNLYVGGSANIWKLESTENSVANGLRESGLRPPGLLIESMGPGHAIPTGKSAAYRAVLKRRDGNGLEVRSAPTGPQIIAAGVDSTVSLSVVFIAGDFNTVLGDEVTVEVYRTRCVDVGITLPNEYYLAGEVKRSSPGVSTFADDKPDNQLGAVLYTSSSRESLEGSNYRAPSAAVMETYRGCLFAGNTVSPFRKFVTFSYVFSATSGALCEGLAVCTASSGDSVISVPAGTDWIEVGSMPMAQTLHSTKFSPGTHVTAKTSTTITISSPLLAALAAEEVRVIDAIHVDGDAFPLFFYGEPSADAFGDISSAMAGACPAFCAASERFYANVVSRDYIITEGATVITLLIEEKARSLASATAPQLVASKGNLYSPNMGTFPGAPVDMERDVLPNGFAWSKQDEPEHFAPSATGREGDTSKAILGLKATRDALFILKEDGIWRLTGTHPSNWRTDPFDLTTFCVLPTSVVAMDNAIFMLSNKGFVRISDSGVEKISFPNVQKEALALVEQCTSNFLADGAYSIDDMPGDSAAINSKHGEVRFASGPNSAIVYNTRTDAWTTWSFVGDGTAGITLAGLLTIRIIDFVFAFGTVDGSLLLDTPTFSGADVLGFPAAYDAADPVGVASVAASTHEDKAAAVITLGSVYHALDGDLVRTGTRVYRVVAVDGGTNITVLLNADGVLPLGTGSVIIYRPIHCAVQFAPFMAPMFVSKVWKQLVFAFAKMTGVAELEHATASSLSMTAAADQQDPVPMKITRALGYTKYHMGHLPRHLVTRAFSRAWLMTSELRWTMAFGEVSLEGAAADADVASPENPKPNNAS